MTTPQTYITTIVIPSPHISKRFFIQYLTDIFNSIVDQKSKGMTKTQFLILFNNHLPIFLLEKLYESFGQVEDNNLSLRDFIRGILGWLYGSTLWKIKLFGKLLNFHHNDQIYKDDVILLFIHIHYQDFTNNHEPLTNIITGFFQDEDKMTLEEFEEMNKENEDLIVFSVYSLSKRILFNDTLLKFYEEKCVKLISKISNTEMNEYLKGIEFPLQKNNQDVISYNLSKNMFMYLMKNDEGKLKEMNIDITNVQCSTNDNSNIVLYEHEEENDDELDDLNIFESDLTQIKTDSCFELIRKKSSTLSSYSSDNDSSKEIDTSHKMTAKMSSSYLMEIKSETKPKNNVRSSYSSNDVINHNKPNIFSKFLGSLKENESQPKSDFEFKVEVSFNKNKKFSYEVSLSNQLMFFFNNSKEYDCIIIARSYFKCSKQTNSQGKKYFIADINSYLCQNSKKEFKIFFHKEGDMLRFERVLKEQLNYRDVFNDYNQIEEIGKGVFGIIMLCVHKKTKEKVAIKIIKKQISNQEQDVQMILWEINVLKLLMKITHRNIIQIKDIYETEDRYYIITPYYPHGSLIEYNKNHPIFSPINTLSIMNQITSALVFLNSLGIMHRDIKPTNVLISDYNESSINVKLIDFGFAKVTSYYSTSKEWYGSFGFSAPEITSQRNYHHKIDCWSLGILCYYLQYQSIPNDEDEIKEYCLATNTSYHKSIKEKDCHDLLNKIIISCLKKDMNTRSSITELHNLLMIEYTE